MTDKQMANFLQHLYDKIICYCQLNAKLMPKLLSSAHTFEE